MTESDIEVGKTYQFKNSFNEITESTVIEMNAPKPWMLTFQKPNGAVHSVTITGFLRVWKLYGVGGESTDATAKVK